MFAQHGIVATRANEGDLRFVSCNCEVNVEQSADKVLQQLKSEYCCRECVMDEAKKYAHAKRNPTLLLYYDSSGAVLPRGGANVLHSEAYGVNITGNRNLDWDPRGRVLHFKL